MASILIIDDDEDIIDLFVEYFSLMGHEILGKALDGNEALTEYNNHLPNEPDYIILDHRMPRKDGLTTLKELLELNPKLKVIFISADYSIREKALEYGALSFLAKPVNFQVLLDLIE